MPLQRRALIVVEPRFAAEHIGVRRVIANYWTRLRRTAFEVELGVISGGNLYKVSAQAAEATYAIVTGARHGTDAVTWGSESTPSNRRKHWWGASSAGKAAPPTPDLELAIERECRASEYDVSVLSNAWLCSQAMPDWQFTHGIVYDLVPNLLGAQILDFGLPSFGVMEFAHAHHRGYEYFLDHVSTILCISESTKRDFMRYYLPDRSIKVVVDIPFDLDDFCGEPAAQTVARVSNDRAKVLLVNVLDPRKNIAQVARALAAASAATALDVDVVGRERLSDQSEAVDFFRVMASNGARVKWYRDASDELLRGLYRSADVLLFPSLYEGLGLPLLEAQSLGTPVISGANSSLREINFNEGLFVDPSSATDIAEKLESFLRGPLVLARGANLIERTRAYLEENHRFEQQLQERI